MFLISNVFNKCILTIYILHVYCTHIFIYTRELMTLLTFFVFGYNRFLWLATDNLTICFLLTNINFGFFLFIHNYNITDSIIVRVLLYYFSTSLFIRLKIEFRVERRVNGENVSTLTTGDIMLRIYPFSWMIIYG